VKNVYSNEILCSRFHLYVFQPLKGMEQVRTVLCRIFIYRRIEFEAMVRHLILSLLCLVSKAAVECPASYPQEGSGPTFIPIHFM